MIYIQINGLLIEGESVVQVHAHMEIKHYHHHSSNTTQQLPDDDTITQIMRDVLKSITK